MVVAKNAGQAASYSDADYQAVGATIGTQKEALGADVVTKVSGG